MLGRSIALAAVVAVSGAACAQQGHAEPALCGKAKTIADTVLAYPDGMACLGAINVDTGKPFGHVIVVNEPCGVLLSTTAEDDQCVRTSHTGRIIPLSSFDPNVDPGYSKVDG